MIRLGYDNDSLDYIASTLWCDEDIRRSLDDDMNRPSYLVRLADMLRSGDVIAYAPVIEGEPVGMIWAMTGIDGELLTHIHIMRKAWGSTVELALEAKSAFEAEVGCSKFVALIPEFNRLARSFARRVGFVECGIADSKYTRKGVEHRCWRYELPAERS